MLRAKKILSSDHQSEKVLEKALTLFTRRWRQNEENGKRRHRMEIAPGEILDGPVIAGEVLKEMFDITDATAKVVATV